MTVSYYRVIVSIFYKFSYAVIRKDKNEAIFARLSS